VFVCPALAGHGCFDSETGASAFKVQGSGVPAS
jgi:hypothetical protein